MILHRQNYYSLYLIMFQLNLFLRNLQNFLLLTIKITIFNYLIRVLNLLIFDFGNWSKYLEVIKFTVLHLLQIKYFSNFIGFINYYFLNVLFITICFTRLCFIGYYFIILIYCLYFILPYV